MEDKFNSLTMDLFDLGNKIILTRVVNFPGMDPNIMAKREKRMCQLIKEKISKITGNTQEIKISFHRESIIINTFLPIKVFMGLFIMIPQNNEPQSTKKSRNSYAYYLRTEEEYKEGKTNVIILLHYYNSQEIKLYRKYFTRG